MGKGSFGALVMCSMAIALEALVVEVAGSRVIARVVAGSHSTAIVRVEVAHIEVEVAEAGDSRGRVLRPKA